MTTRRLTVAQATIEFLSQQYTERDGARRRLIPGVFGIFGHGNLAGFGQALLQTQSDIRYYQARNEQAMVHAAAAYAKQSDRLATLACTTSIGPGATNMLTAAAGATINRLPVLLLPGDLFATRQVAPVLQQLEATWTQDASVNDAFKPISKYWDRINRPEQLVTSLLEAMRVLTSPAETGAVTVAVPQDVQAEAADFPEELFRPRVWRVTRPRPDLGVLAEAAQAISRAKKPVIISGGGVIYSSATAALERFVEDTGIPVGETQAGKGSLPYDHDYLLGSVGVSGSPGANAVARDADVVIGIGTRYTDFTTASKTEFQNPDVTFVNINITDFDAAKHAGIPVVGDARAVLSELRELVRGYRVLDTHAAGARALADAWRQEVSELVAQAGAESPSQASIIGVVNNHTEPTDVVVCAAGSLPGDLHRLWQSRDPKGYHMEYGYSCMGYEVAGGLGAKMAAPDREVYVFVGDGSYAMMSSEILTAVQEGIKITVLLVNNHGFGSIAALSEMLGSQAFGTPFRRRGDDGKLSGEYLPFDLASNARSLGAYVLEPKGLDELVTALKDARASERATVIVLEVDAQGRFGGSGAWWNVPVSEVSELESTRAARADYEVARAAARYHL